MKWGWLIAGPLFFYPNSKEMFLIASTKYTIEKIDAVYYGDIYTIINLTPEIHKDDRQERKNEIEKSLYAVFSKYTSKTKRK